MSDATDDERFLVVNGRRWRRTDPSLSGEVVARLKSHLGRARSSVRVEGNKGDADAVADARRRVQIAKTGLGERGLVWWEHAQVERAARADDALAELDRLAPPVES